MSRLSKRVFVKLAFSVVICVVLSILLFGLSTNNTLKQYDSGSYESSDAFALTQTSANVSSGWTITSYQDNNEAVYTGVKLEVFDYKKKSLGFYKTDFLEQIKIDGSGKGDGIRNTGKFLHYDYNVDNGKTYYLSNISLGAYENELVPWTGDRPSIAVNPPLPLGTQIRFINLGSDAQYNLPGVNELLMNKTFYADDKFYGVTGKKIDVYVGLQKVKDTAGTPESLWMQNVTVSIEPPCVATNIPETICNGIDDNCDGKIDERCIPNATLPNTTVPNTTIPHPPKNTTLPNTTTPNTTVPNVTTPKINFTCQYASSAAATSQNTNSKAIYATGAPNAPRVGNCAIWSGYKYTWSPKKWNVKANITLNYKTAVNVSNFTIFGDYDMCWNKMWLKNSANGRKIQVFNGFDTKCISTYQQNNNFSADTIILETCGWSWSYTDAVQLCGRK